MASTVQGDKEEEQKAQSKTLLKSDALYQYILETTALPREPECLREIRLLTAKHTWAIMGTAPDEAQLLSILLKTMGAKRTIEVGVFTGYSLLATALALPHDGQILAIDIDRKNYELGLPSIEKAGVAHKIDFRHGSALPILHQLAAEGEHKGAYDFAFVDADKVNYINYHAPLLELVRPGGIIAYDNTLWGGTVAWRPGMPPSIREHLVAEFARTINVPGREPSVEENRIAIGEFNAAIAADPRVEVCQLSIADGVTLCHRL